MTTAIANSNHTYTTPSGRVVGGISSVLRTAGLLADMPTGNEAAMHRGSRIHKGIELDTRGELDESSIDPVELSLVMMAKAKREVMALEIVGVEVPVCNEALGYGTAVDAVVRWEGKLTVVNYKTGNFYPHYPIQMALEALCFEEPVRRLAIYLRKGKPCIHQEYTDSQDYIVARAAATISAWKRATAKGHADMNVIAEDL